MATQSSILYENNKILNELKNSHGHLDLTKSRSKFSIFKTCIRSLGFEIASIRAGSIVSSTVRHVLGETNTGAELVGDDESLKN
jgi:hypothetical protein